MAHVLAHRSHALTWTIHDCVTGPTPRCTHCSVLASPLSLTVPWELGEPRLDDVWQYE